jgi:hypothetical protein
MNGRLRAARRLSTVLALAAAIHLVPVRADDANCVSPAARGAVAIDTAAGWVRCDGQEVHDLCADFARLLPGKQDGRVLRIHVMTDSDGGRMAAAHAESRFANQCPSRASLAEGGAVSPARGRP